MPLTESIDLGSPSTFRDALKEDRCFFFMRAREALYTALVAMEIGRGGEVALQGFTCLAVPIPILYTGAVAIYVDIEPERYSPALSTLKTVVTSKLKAVVIQHTFGIPADVECLRTECRLSDTFVIEDCSHTWASEWASGRAVGSLGDVAFFSLEYAKPVSVGNGGVLIVNNPKLIAPIRAAVEQLNKPSVTETLLLRLQHEAYQRLVTPRTYWYMRQLYRGLSGAGLVIGSFRSSELQVSPSLGYARCLSNWQLQAFLKQIGAVQVDAQRRRALASSYGDRLRTAGFRVNPILEANGSVLLRYPISIAYKTNALIAAAQRGVELGDWYRTPVHPLTGEELRRVGYEPGFCRNAEWAASSVVNLPMHKGITESYMDQIIKIIRDNSDGREAV